MIDTCDCSPATTISRGDASARLLARRRQRQHVNRLARRRPARAISITTTSSKNAVIQIDERTVGALAAATGTGRRSACTRRRLRTVTPAGSAPSDESDCDDAAVDATTIVAAPANEQRRGLADRSGTTRRRARTARRQSGATFVKRHSSSRRGRKPAREEAVERGLARSAERARPERRLAPERLEGRRDDVRAVRRLGS